MELMVIEQNKVVSLSYTLKAKNDKVIEAFIVEETEAMRPFLFMFGTGHLLEEFERNLKGKKAEDLFDFKIESEKGYGLRDENYVVNIPLDAFKAADGTIDLEAIKIGNTLPMADNEGNKLQGKVEDVTPEFVKMDFNHPLAGHELHFTGKVLNVRNATQEEISHGHVHGEGGHHH